MNYLVIHIDKDFISSTVCVENGISVPITQGSDNMLWLYFFNNPHQDRVSFGRENRNHYNERKLNYYGNFTDKINDETETFTIRGIKKPIIELLEYSDLIKLLHSSFEQITRQSSESIPTLITFSFSISDLSKQILVDYLSKKSFDIKSYTIPLSELTCYNLYSNKKFSVANGSSVLFLSATNSTLHIMKMVFSENYFMIDGEIESFKGKGIDPRKRALVKYVINELNKSTGALSSIDEIEDECVRKEHQADEWLKRLDAQSSNHPLSIIESLSVMQSTKLQVLVRKEHIDIDTAHYVNELSDIFDFFKSKHFTGDVGGLFLFGDCFLSSLVNKKFKNYISDDKLFVFGNSVIPEILASYPKIDFKRYNDHESRIKSLAEAEELKQIEQRVLEDRLRKEEELLQNQEASEKQAELNKIEAQKKYERAVELELEGKLEDAKINIEQALLLDNTSKQISIYHSNLLDIIHIRDEKNNLYKNYLSKAEKFKEQNKYDKALEEYEAAKVVFDNAEILKAIIEIKKLIEQSKKEKEQIADLLSQVNSLLRKNKFDEVESKLNEVLDVDSTNKDAIKLLVEIPILKNQYQEELKKQEIILQFEKYVKSANGLFESGKYEEAKEKYELAASIQKDNNVADRINACNDRLKEIEDLYIDLLNKATHFENSGDLTQAIDFLNQAITLKGKNEELKSRVKKLKFDLEFKSSTIPTNQNKTKTSKPNIDKTTNNRVQEEFFDFDRKKEIISKSQTNEVDNKENFFNTKTKNGMKKNHDGFDFLKTGSHKNETKSNIDGEDDFSNNVNKKNINTTKENFDW